LHILFDNRDRCDRHIRRKPLRGFRPTLIDAPT
jgi:hypothetical protein